MNPEEFERIRHNVTSQLAAILKRVDGRVGKFKPGDEIPIEILVARVRANEGKLLLIDGDYRMVYIKDNAYFTEGECAEEVRLHDNDCFVSGKRVHFYACQTLAQMARSSRFKDRYHLTDTSINTRIIDLQNARDVKVRLAYCWHCISLLLGKMPLHRIVHPDDYERIKERVSEIGEKYALAQFGNAADLMQCAIEYYENGGRIPLPEHQTEGLRGSDAPTGYTNDWHERSLRYRRAKEFRCEKCGVDCGENTSLVDTHHKNSNKADNSIANLECLCKLCHRTVHPHYHVSENHVQILLRLCKEQNIAHE